MKFEDALRKVLKVYWEDNDEYETMNTSKGERKYNKKYFDSIEEELLSAPKKSGKEKK